MKIKTRLKQLQPIHLLLLVYVLIQCIGITNPPLEIGHNWRQTVTAMIARNLQNNHFNLWYPEVDFTGKTKGILGSEFPFFQSLIALLNTILGYTHWHGRIINLLISTWGAWAFHQIITGLFSRKIALNATAILIFSVWFSFCRKIMPDTFSIALMMIGLRQVQLYYNQIKIIHLFYAWLAIAFSILSKLPAIAWLAIFALVIPWSFSTSKQKSIHKTSHTKVLLTVLIACIPGLIWYFYWVPKLNQHFQLYYPKSLSEGVAEILPHWKLLLEKFYFTAFYSFTALALFILGFIGIFSKNTSIIYLNKTHQLTIIKYFRYSLLLFIVAFSIFIIKTGDVFPKHTYYIIPFMPLMSILAALGLEQIHHNIPVNSNNPWRRTSVILLIIAVSEAFLNQIHELQIKPSEYYKMELESIQKQLPPSAKIISNAGVNPQELYLLNRKGWVRFPHQICNQHHLDSLIKESANYLVINNNLQNSDSVLPYKEIHQSKNFRVLDLSQKK